MATKPESQLWGKLKAGTKDLGVFWTRVESWSSPGIPDLHGIVDGQAFWLELKIHNAKSISNVRLRPHQISWQTRYSAQGGNVWNLVEHVASRTVNLYWGGRAMELAGQTDLKGPCEPDWSSGSPVRWREVMTTITNGYDENKR